MLDPVLNNYSRERVQAALEGDDISDHDARQAQLLFRAFADTDARDAAGCGQAKKVIGELRAVSGYPV